MRFVKFAAAMLVVCCLFWLGGLLADRHSLNNTIVCLQIFYDSKESADKRVDIRLKNAVAFCMMDEGTEAGEWCDLEMLSEEVNAAVNNVLRENNASSKADISFDEEFIEAEQYDTVFLPTGKYKAIRIYIGDGKGRLCRAVAYHGNSKNLAECTLEKHLQETIGLDRNRQVRLFFLECFGRIEKITVWKG